MKKYFVNFKNWYNNWSDPIEVAEYDNLQDALQRAKEMDSFTCDNIGDNNYVCNGMQTWVDDNDGNHYDVAI